LTLYFGIGTLQQQPGQFLVKRETAKIKDWGKCEVSPGNGINQRPKDKKKTKTTPKLQKTLREKKRKKNKTLSINPQRN